MICVSRQMSPRPSPRQSVVGLEGVGEVGGGGGGVVGGGVGGGGVGGVIARIIGDDGDDDDDPGPGHSLSSLARLRPGS